MSDTTEKDKSKGGRPRKEIDKDMFEKLCAIQCTESEICSFFDTTDKTLTRWCNDTYGMSYSDIYKIKSAGGKTSLRRMQFKLAEKNPAMAIFLGKQYLGQKDKIEYTDDGMKAINENINNIANLLNNPKPNRNDKDV